MEDLINFVSQKSDLPRHLAKAATNATLEYLLPASSSRLLKTYIEVTLNYPSLSDGERNFLFASKILFPNDTPPTHDASIFND